MTPMEASTYRHSRSSSILPFHNHKLHVRAALVREEISWLVVTEANSDACLC